jgi:GH18 family chitinase
MAIRRPSISSPDWLFQDFLYQAADAPGGSELRYVQIKWDGQPYTRVSQSFDYSDPPYVGSEQRGGSIVGQIDYEINPSTRLITIYSWEVNWRDEWPLRLGVNYLTQCLYPGSTGYTIRVAGNQVYTSAGQALEDPSNFPYAFWVSERYNPVTNNPDDYLLRLAYPPDSPSPNPVVYGFSSDFVITFPESYILITISSENLPLQTTLHWELTGDVSPLFLRTGFTEGVVLVNSNPSFLKLVLDLPLPGPGPYSAHIEFYSDSAKTKVVGYADVEVYSPPTPPNLNPVKLGAYIDLWQYRNTDALYPYVANSGWNPVVRAANISANAIPLLNKFYLLSEVQLNGADSLLYFGNPVGFPAAAQVLNPAGTDWNTNTGSPQGTFVAPGNPDYTYSAWALKNTIAYMVNQNVDRNSFMLCIGGYLLSDNMDLAGSSPVTAATAAAQIVTLMNLCGAKGVDMDYEPVGISCNPGRMATLMEAIYVAVKAVNPTYEVHLTLIPSLSQADPDLKIATAAACQDFADQVNIMTYDDPSTLGQPLYQPGNITVFNHTGVTRSVQSVQWFINAGVAPDKLGMGIALYARNSASPGAAFTAQNPVAYSQIVASANTAGQTSNSFPLGRYQGSANIQNPAPTGQFDYYSPLATALWAFDSVDTIESKVQAAAKMSLRAVFAWQISNDYANPASTAAPGDARANFALLSAAQKAISNL